MTDPATPPVNPLPEQNKPPVTGAYQTDAQKKAEAERLAEKSPAVKS